MQDWLIDVKTLLPALHEQFSEGSCFRTEFTYERIDEALAEETFQPPKRPDLKSQPLEPLQRGLRSLLPQRPRRERWPHECSLGPIRQEGTVQQRSELTAPDDDCLRVPLAHAAKQGPTTPTPPAVFEATHFARK